MKKLSLQVITFLSCVAGLCGAEPAAKSEVTPPYEAKAKSTFGLDKEARAPFWPIGWYRNAPAPVEAAAVVVEAKFELDPGLFHVSSILAAGNPALAIINQRSYGEGENIRIPKSANLPAKVRVMRILPDKVILNCKDSTVEVPLRRPELGPRQPQVEMELDQ